MESFLIGDILVRLDYAGVPALTDGNLRLFRHEGRWDGEPLSLECSCEPLSDYLAHPITRDNPVYGIYEHGGERLLSYRWGNLFHGFAVWPERFAVTFDPRMLRQPPLRPDWFFSVCAFHRQLLLRHGCVLHASFIDVGGEAILFTGPSGIGKSTQARLWVEHEGAEVINGDRALLRKRDGRWHAFGYPCCGTSGICLDRTLPLRAVVMLSQAAENRVSVPSAAEKVRALTAAMELYPWDRREIDMAMSVAMDLASGVPIVKLACRPDAGAVEALKRHLEVNP